MLSKADSSDTAGLLGVFEDCLARRYGDVAPALDATLGQVYAEGPRRRDDGVRRPIGKLKAVGALGFDLEPAQALGLLSTPCWPEAFAELTGCHGWRVDQCETWTTGALRRLVLKPS